MSLEMIVFTVNEHENILFVGQASGYAIDYKKHVSLSCAQPSVGIKVTYILGNFSRKFSFEI